MDHLPDLSIQLSIFLLSNGLLGRRSVTWSVGLTRANRRELTGEGGDARSRLVVQQVVAQLVYAEI